MEYTSLYKRNLVIYQIFTRNYGDGTFRAVTDDLSRIKDLGVDMIYLLPIQPSGEEHRKGSMGSPYAIRDYRAIDPIQGTMDDFIALTQKAHEIGLKVMIDVVYNHTSPDSKLAAEHPEWFYHKKDGSLGNRIGDWWDVVDLDYSHEQLWEYQIETLKMYAEYVDGFRCDVAPMIPLEFWKRAREEVAQVRPDCLWLAEAVEPEFIRMNRMAGVPTLTDAELYQAFDICYDYDVYRYMAGCMEGENTLAEYLANVDRQELIYPADFSKLRCLENHDRPRAAALVPNEKILRNWTAWTYFCKGTVMLYAGQEYMALHHPTLFDRDTVDMSGEPVLSNLMKTLGSIKKNPVFTYGLMNTEAVGIDKKIIYAQYKMPADAPNKDDWAVGIFSTSGQAQALHVSLPDGIYTDRISGKKIDVFEGVFAYDGGPLILMG